MKDVFISYKAEEFDDANWVKSVLENNGISCWMAPACIPGGSSYAIEIPNAIKNAKVFVLMLSAKSQTSQWVSREVDLALNEGKIVMPFMLENCALRDDFNFYLTNVQRYAAYENKSAAMRKMIGEIKALIGNSSNPLEMFSEYFTTPPKPKTQSEKTQKNQKYDVYCVLSAVFGFIASIALSGALILPNLVACILALVGIKKVAEKKCEGKIFAIVGLFLGCATNLIGSFLLAGAISLAVAVAVDILFIVLFVRNYKKI